MMAPPRSLAASLLALVAANAVPLVGVLAFGWSLFGVILLYWIESAIVGAFAVLRILSAQGDPGAGGWHDKATGRPVPNTLARRVRLAVFFAFHYGLFWVGHLVLLATTLGTSLTAADAAWAGAGRPDEGPLAFTLSLASLGASHGLAFALGYLGRGAYRTALPDNQMWAPYARVFVFQLAVMGGGALAARWGSPVWALAALVALKTIVDAGTLAVMAEPHAPEPSPAEPAAAADF